MTRRTLVATLFRETLPTWATVLALLAPVGAGHASDAAAPTAPTAPPARPAPQPPSTTAIPAPAKAGHAPDKQAPDKQPPARKPAARDTDAARAERVDEQSLLQLRERLVERLAANRMRSEVVTVASRADSAPRTADPLSPDPTRTHGSTARAAAAHRAVHTAPHGNPSASPHKAHWSYHGDTGPDAWGRMQPEFATCANGQRQSPIDIRGGIRVDLEPVQFDYRASRFAVVDNGHTVQVNVEAGNAITVMGRRFDLVQFHFHRPSEERIDGRQFDMVAHLVHKDSDGKLAVVAVLLDRGSAHPLVQTVWNNLPLEKDDEVRASGTLDLANLLPQDRRYHIYMGSLTTPPCSEGVTWIVMAQPVAISSEQIGVFSHLYPMNARPIQAPSGRLIKSSN